MDEFMSDPAPGPELVRQQSWPVDGPAELELAVDVGRITVRLDAEDSGTGEVHVEVRHDPSSAGTWSQGLTGLISWLGGATGTMSGGTDDVAAAAVRAAEISWSESGRRLVVRSSQELPLRVVPLAITVTAPDRSRLAARTGAGEVHVTGRAGWVGVRTGSGRASIELVDGDADVTTGSGDIELGPVSGRARLRAGSGRVSVAATGAAAEVRTGSGDISLGAVAGDLQLRSGSGDVEIADAQRGAYDLTTGSGRLRIGVHPGVAAELDLSTGSGQARSDLEVVGVQPERPAEVQVRGRTGSGDVLVARAAVSA